MPANRKTYLMRFFFVLAAVTLGLASVVTDAAARESTSSDEGTTFGEVWNRYDSGKELSPQQAEYITGVLRTIHRLDSASWELHDRGLFCTTSRVDMPFLLRSMVAEVSSERGWVYGVSEGVDRILVDSLLHQYPCTKEALATQRALRDREQRAFDKFLDTVQPDPKSSQR